MQSNIMLSSFYLKNRFARDENDCIDLNNEFTDVKTGVVYSDIFEMLREFNRLNIVPTDDEKSQKVFSIKEDSYVYLDKDKYRIFSFTVLSGSYGIESDMIDHETNEFKFHRNSNLADVKPFKIMFFIPRQLDENEINKGIILFQTVGPFGVKIITTKQLKRYFETKNLTFETRSISSREFVRRLLDSGNLNRIKFVKNRLSPDSSDNMVASYGKEERSYFKPRLSEKFQGALLDYIDRKNFDDIFEFEDETIDSINFDFQISGKSRKCNLQNIDTLSIIEEIPEEIYLDGNFDEEKLLEYMEQTANIYKNRMVFTIQKG